MNDDDAKDAQVEELWLKFRRNVMNPSGLQFGPSQEAEMRRLFKAGAFDLFISLFADPAARLTKEKLELIERERKTFLAECDALARKYRAEHFDRFVKRAGKGSRN